jgi:cell division septation protein DedD
VTIRHDHLMVGAIVGLIGLTVVFACGVERGKRVSRAEHAAPLLGPRATADSAATQPSRPATPANTTPAPATVPAAAPTSSPAPTKLARGPSFAVQVVTYRQRPLAQREMQRLQSRGERVFLAMTDGHTRVLIGPFDSKGDARSKSAQLRSRYRDCFVRTL